MRSVLSCRTTLALSCVLLSLALAGCKDILFSRLTEPQANEVVAALAEARIAASKTRVDDTTWQIEVDDAVVGQALVLLRQRGLPSQPATSLGEVFKKEGMISSPQEERARYEHALQESIAATLRRIDGVVDARVHVVIPHNDPLSTRVIPATASVLVKHRASLDMEMLGPNIKSMVMSSVEGLDYRNIALLALPVERSALADAPARHHAGLISAHAATMLADAAQPPDVAAPLQGSSWWAVGFAGAALTGLWAWLIRSRRPDVDADSDDTAAATTLVVPRQRPAAPVSLALASTVGSGLFDTRGPVADKVIAAELSAPSPADDANEKDG
jgi:type III secretion protein J